MKQGKLNRRSSNESGLTTRARLKRIALEAFISLGFRGLSVAELARRAKTSKPAVLYHYRHPDEILLELMVDWAQTGKQVTDSYLANYLGRSPEDIVLAIQDATFEWLEAQPEMAAFSTVLIQAATELPVVQTFLNEVFSAGRSRIEGLLLKIPEIESGHSRPEIRGLAASIHCLIFGSCLYILAQRDWISLNKTAQFNRESLRTILRSARLAR